MCPDRRHRTDYAPGNGPDRAGLCQQEPSDEGLTATLSHCTEAGGGANARCARLTLALPVSAVIPTGTRAPRQSWK